MTEISNVDICCGLCWGDEAKGKIVSQLLKNNKYDWVCRWSGGSNAGHTIYIDNVKYATHIIPAGIFYNIPCYIGPDCYINYYHLKSEMEYLKNHGFDTSLIYISNKAHVITDDHITEDNAIYKGQQGSTGTGIAPCAKDKYGRNGKRIEDDDMFPFKENLWTSENIPLKGNILCEGAQGIWLDINYGSYPYVTSSNTLPYSACSLGFPPQKIRNIYGACKVYDTRVGVDPYFSHNECKKYKTIFNTIASVGEEYGTTTKRLRKVEWLNIDKLIEAINISGTNIIVISKLDILEKVNMYVYIYNGKYEEHSNKDDFVNSINNIIHEKCTYVCKIVYSNNPISVNDLP